MAQLERKKRKLPKWKETFILKQTYDNMRITVAGFFGFCEYIIEQAQILPNIPKNVKRKFAISPAQSNQSFGKAWFSFSCHMGFDTAAKYMFGITANLMPKVVQKSLKKKESSLDSNQMYDPEDIGEIKGGQNDMTLKEFRGMLKDTRKCAEVKLD